jgi:hypothetical protein
MIPAELKKWLAFGSGVGIEIAGPHGSETLRAVAVRVRPNGVRVLGELTIEDVPHQPAGVWGTDFAAFVRKLGLRHVPATVLLPRQDLILRHLALPGVSDKDLAAAIQFQMDGLHPYAEEDVLSSWARLPGTSGVVVAIARRAAIERYATLFAEAGVRVGCFTSSAAAIHSALRLYGNQPSPEILVEQAILSPAIIEFYGESPARPFFSAAFDASDPRAAALACAELRLDPNTEPQPLDRLLGVASPFPYAAALASACPRHCLPLNLLPVEQRDISSRAVWIPSAALGAVVLLLGGALGAFPKYEDRRYLRSLQSEIAKVTPAATRSGNLDREIETARRRVVLLDGFRGRAKADMDVLGEMTRLMPPTTWLNYLEVTRTQVIFAGETDQAAPLLKLVDASPFFVGSEFAMPPTAMRTQPGELFRIRANREAGK